MSLDKAYKKIQDEKSGIEAWCISKIEDKKKKIQDIKCDIDNLKSICKNEKGYDNRKKAEDIIKHFQNVTRTHTGYSVYRIFMMIDEYNNEMFTNKTYNEKSYSFRKNLIGIPGITVSSTPEQNIKVDFTLTGYKWREGVDITLETTFRDIIGMYKWSGHICFDNVDEDQLTKHLNLCAHETHSDEHLRSLCCFDDPWDDGGVIGSEFQFETCMFYSINYRPDSTKKMCDENWWKDHGYYSSESDTESDEESNEESNKESNKESTEESTGESNKESIGESNKESDNDVNTPTLSEQIENLDNELTKIENKKVKKYIKKARRIISNINDHDSYTYTVVIPREDDSPGTIWYWLKNIGNIEKLKKKPTIKIEYEFHIKDMEFECKPTIPINCGDISYADLIIDEKKKFWTKYLKEMYPEPIEIKTELKSGDSSGKKMVDISDYINVIVYKKSN